MRGLASLLSSAVPQRSPSPSASPQREPASPHLSPSPTSPTTHCDAERARPIPFASQSSRGLQSEALIASTSTVSPSPASPGSQTSSPRHHFRTEELLEASGIPPRELRWECRGEKGEGLQLAGSPEETGGRSWGEDVAERGIPCRPAEDIRAVHSSTVQVESSSGTPPSPSSGSGIRRRSIHGDLDWRE
ncbi:hypothetical protein JCM10213_002257 [Rhodosporidiobolus nylandii]